jgi:hypothetical protein
MTDARLPEDLARLERALARRLLPEAPAGLRMRVLGEVQRTRARERGLSLAFAAAAAAAVGALWLSMPAEDQRPSWPPRPLVQAEARALEKLGLDADDAERLAFVAHAARLQPLAPPVGSGSEDIPATGRR